MHVRGSIYEVLPEGAEVSGIVELQEDRLWIPLVVCF